MKAVVAAFNQEKALVGAFSVIVKTDYETDGALHSTNHHPSSVQFSSVTPPPATMILRCALLLTVVVLPFYYSQGEVELVTQLSGLFVNTLHIIMRKYKYLQL